MSWLMFSSLPHAVGLANSRISPIQSSMPWEIGLHFQQFGIELWMVYIYPEWEIAGKIVYRRPSICQMSKMPFVMYERSKSKPINNTAVLHSDTASSKDVGKRRQQTREVDSWKLTAIGVANGRLGRLRTVGEIIVFSPTATARLKLGIHHPVRRCPDTACLLCWVRRAWGLNILTGEL